MIDNDPTSATFNSYGDVSGLMAFAKSRGYDVPEDTAEMLLFQALDFLNLQSWAGEPTDSTQPLPWPRSGVTVGRRDIPGDKILQRSLQRNTGWLLLRKRSISCLATPAHKP